jgi:mono/diheme cytochrome c family protein
MKRLTQAASLTAILLLIGLTGCSSEPETEAEREARWQQGKFTSWELEHGIGPITEAIELASVSQERVAKGENIYIAKCATCHYLDDRKTGPPLRDITKRRSPEYVLNQILNAEQMGKLHPDGRKLVAQYAQYMTIQGVTREDAMALLDFLRAEADKPPVPIDQQPGAAVPPPSN